MMKIFLNLSSYTKEKYKIDSNDFKEIDKVIEFDGLALDDILNVDNNSLVITDNYGLFEYFKKNNKKEIIFFSSIKIETNEASKKIIEETVEELRKEILTTRVSGVSLKNDDNTSRQDYIKELKIYDKVILEHEKDNPYDKNAIKVLTTNNNHLGYIPKEKNTELLDFLNKDIEVVVNKIPGGNTVPLGLRLKVYEIEKRINKIEKTINSYNYFCSNNMEEIISFLLIMNKKGYVNTLDEFEKEDMEISEKKFIEEAKLTKILIDNINENISNYSSNYSNEQSLFLSEMRSSLNKYLNTRLKNGLDRLKEVKLPKMDVPKAKKEPLKRIKNIRSYYAVVYNMTISSPKSKDVFLKANILNNIRENRLDIYEWILPPSLKGNKNTKEVITEIFNEVSSLLILANEKFERPKVFFGPNENYLTRNEFDLSNYSIWIEDSIKYNINKNDNNHILSLNYFLKRLFGFKSFREGQIEIISNILKRINTLGILTTGAGKSLTYYFAVLLQPKQSLIIAPINSLIKDQARILNEIHKINRVSVLNNESGNNLFVEIEKMESLFSIFNFCSPERLQDENFRETLLKLTKSKNLGTVVFDEVHCLSEWGHDFRVSYLMVTETIKTYSKEVNFLGLTATASIRVLRDLINELYVYEDDVKYSSTIKRDNLNFYIKSFENKGLALKEMYGNVSNILAEENQSALVFSRTIGSGKYNNRFSIDYLKQKYIDNYHGNDEIGIFHGGYKEDQDAFMNGDKKVLFVTKAFGMGIDKPNIRLTIHLGMPSSREEFFQEAGRAGRDNNDSVCLLYSITPSSYQENRIREYFVTDKKIEIDFQADLDIESNMYFFNQDFETPENEGHLINNYYNEILSGKSIFDFNNRRGRYETGIKSDEYDKYFYSLHKMGVIKNWVVKYKGGIYTGYYKIELYDNHKSVENIQKNILEYIGSNVTKEELESYALIISKEKNVQKLATILRKWYHKGFILTRKREMENMYSMIKEFSNKLGSSDELQNIMESYFNLDSLLGRTADDMTLDFNDNNFEEVIDYAFGIDNNDLSNKYRESERMLESYPDNQKTLLFISLLTLRLNNFETNSNGNEVFKRIYPKLKLEDKNMLDSKIIEYFELIEEGQKKSFFETLNELNEDFNVIYNVYIKYYNNPVLARLVLENINNLTKEFTNDKL